MDMFTFTFEVMTLDVQIWMVSILNVPCQVGADAIGISSSTWISRTKTSVFFFFRPKNCMKNLAAFLLVHSLQVALASSCELIK